MLREQVDKHGGMVKKYNTLIQGLSNLPNSSLTKVSRSEIHLNSSVENVLMKFEIIETFDKVVIYLITTVTGYTKQKKEWSYAPVYPQEKILEDIQTFLKWLLNDNLHVTEAINNDINKNQTIFPKEKLVDKKIVDPKEVFELCKSTSELLPLNYIHEFNIERDDEELDFYYFNNQYEECRKFTALLICCAIASSEKISKSGLTPYDFNSPFFDEFIELIIKESDKIRNQRMFNCFGGFDGEDYYIEETQQYLCMEYLIITAYNIMVSAKDEVTEELMSLAYNYYVCPGTLKYNEHSEAYLYNEEKSKELNSLIGKAMRVIAPKVYISVP